MLPAEGPVFKFGSLLGRVYDLGIADFKRPGVVIKELVSFGREDVGAKIVISMEDVSTPPSHIHPFRTYNFGSLTESCV